MKLCDWVRPRAAALGQVCKGSHKLRTHYPLVDLQLTKFQSKDKYFPYGVSGHDWNSKDGLKYTHIGFTRMEIAGECGGVPDNSHVELSTQVSVWPLLRFSVWPLFVVRQLL